mmetsp:Transcript_21082/g.21394  ORF Transcript_21082/g.21394 Transcript_21082/m.21394 type:complete len:301 (-) Transcript_21082:183-1085(-)
MSSYEVQLRANVLLIVVFLSLVCDSSSYNIVLGPGSLELQLLIAKISAKEGVTTFCQIPEGNGSSCRTLLYGKNRDSKEGDVQFVENLEDVGDAIKMSENIIMVCDTAPMSESFLTAVLNRSEKCKRSILLSRMGISRAQKNLFGGGKEVAMRECEDTVRKEAANRGIELSIVRCGKLKGGGPGREGSDFGLSKVYYDGLFEMEEAMVTQAYDKFTLGGKSCFLGDPIDPGNTFMQLANKGTFEPKLDESSRIVTAGSVVAAALYDKPVEFTVSSSKGMEPPDMGEWKDILSNLATYKKS